VQFFFGTAQHIVPGPTIPLDCPNCRHSGPASTWDREEALTVFFVIPVIHNSTSWVRCSHCHHEILSSLKAAQLAGKTPAEVIGHLIIGPTPWQRRMAVLAVLLFWLPFLGIVISVLAYALNSRDKGWRLPVSLMAALASPVATLVWVVYLGWLG